MDVYINFGDRALGGKSDFDLWWLKARLYGPVVMS
jgi:hypothetical protein